MFQWKVRTFLIVCLLLGAVVVPLGFKYLGNRRQQEIQQLQVKLDQLLGDEPTVGTYLFPSYDRRTFVPYDPVEYKEWRDQVEHLRDRLEHLTGDRPDIPLPAKELSEEDIRGAIEPATKD